MSAGMRILNRAYFSQESCPYTLRVMRVHKRTQLLDIRSVQVYTVTKKIMPAYNSYQRNLDCQILATT
eukprot:2484733-Pleurochrysis_carterae.AAC.1